MRLNWEKNGSAFDEATGLTAQVEHNGHSTQEPWIWFLADWPSLPDDRPEERMPEGTHGRVATEHEAKAAAESALPSGEEMAEICREAEEAWAQHNKKKEARERYWALCAAFNAARKAGDMEELERLKPQLAAACAEADLPVCTVDLLASPIRRPQIRPENNRVYNGTQTQKRPKKGKK